MDIAQASSTFYEGAKKKNIEKCRHEAKRQTLMQDGEISNIDIEKSNEDSSESEVSKISPSKKEQDYFDKNNFTQQQKIDFYKKRDTGYSKGVNGKKWVDKVTVEKEGQKSPSSPDNRKMITPYESNDEWKTKSVSSLRPVKNMSLK